MNNDKNFINIKITKEYINNLFNNNNIVTKKIIIENQEQIKNKLNLCDYLNNNTKRRSIHGKFDSSYVEDLTNKLFFQYYGHYKVLNCLDLDCKYDFIIKTRPDMFYEQFDLAFEQYIVTARQSYQICKDMGMDTKDLEDKFDKLDGTIDMLPEPNNLFVENGFREAIKSC